MEHSITHQDIQTGIERAHLLRSQAAHATLRSLSFALTHPLRMLHRFPHTSPKHQVPA